MLKTRRETCNVWVVQKLDFSTNGITLMKIHKMTRTGKPSPPEQKASIARPTDEEEHAKKAQSFPRELHLLLEHSENTNSRIISWLPDGRSFKIHQKENFARLVMPEFFHPPSTYTSFAHNLSMWGFQIVSKGPIAGAWYHPSFQRSKPQLCQTMNRAKAKGAASIERLEKSSKPEQDSHTHQPSNLGKTVLLHELHPFCEEKE
jgi:hypothetical protein